MYRIKLSEYRIGIKFDKDTLIVEQNNYLPKIVNVYIVYDLDAWPRNPTNNFKFKNCLFKATNIVKNSDKEKYVYRGYGITFDSAGSSSHSDNRKNNFFILGEVPTFGINTKFVLPKKKFSINFTKANTKFCFSLHYNAHLNAKFKVDNKNVKFPTRFCLADIFDEFGATESREVSLNGNVHHFSVDYNSIDKSDILHIHKYLITKNNIK